MNEHRRSEAIRRAIAQEIARRVHITDAAIKARQDYEAAVGTYRRVIRELAEQAI